MLFTRISCPEIWMFETINCSSCYTVVIYDFVIKGISDDQVGGLVVVDIDEASLSINPEIADDSRSVRSGDSDSIEDLLDIPEIPEEAAKLFLNVCCKAKFQFDLVDTKR